MPVSVAATVAAVVSKLGREVEMAASAGTVFMTSAAHKEGGREGECKRRERKRGSKNNTRRNNNAESACGGGHGRVGQSASLISNWGG